uniref:Uncharacterized protein n=1 Tax=Arundo donax TaxID=35708 RepID=A0A0A8YUC9_ARUDO
MMWCCLVQYTTLYLM